MKTGANSALVCFVSQIQYLARYLHKYPHHLHTLLKLSTHSHFPYTQKRISPLASSRKLSPLLLPTYPPTKLFVTSWLISCWLFKADPPHRFLFQSLLFFQDLLHQLYYLLLNFNKRLPMVLEICWRISHLLLWRREGGLSMTLCIPLGATYIPTSTLRWHSKTSFHQMPSYAFKLFSKFCKTPKSPSI